MSDLRRVSLLGVTITPLSAGGLNQLVAEAIAGGHRRVIANHNLHSIHLFHRDPRMRELYARAHAIHADGMPLVLWSRVLGHRVDRQHRTTSLDWHEPLAREGADRRWGFFLLGATSQVAERAAWELLRRFPGLRVAAHHGYFDASLDAKTNTDVLDRIETFGTQVLMVGMGMPRQEHWILENLDRIHANVIFPVGGLFDYLAGTVPTPPRWLGRLGLEWAFRLAAEPRRLWRRYLLEPWALVPWMWRDLVSRRTDGEIRGSAT